MKLDDVRVLQRLGFPDVGRHRRFVTAIGIDALGSGILMPLSMLYFLRQTDLTLVELGLVMSIANLAVTAAGAATSAASSTGSARRA